MTLPFSEELISAYLDGELSAVDKASVELALRDDADLQALYSQLQMLRTTLQAMPRQQPDQDLTEWVLRQAERRMLSGTTPATEPLEPGDAKPVDADRAAASTNSTDRSTSGPSEQSPPSPVRKPRPRDNRWRWRIVLGTLATTAALLLAVFSIPWNGAPKMVADSATDESIQPKAIPAPADDRLATDPAFGRNALTDGGALEESDSNFAPSDKQAPESAAMLGQLSRDGQPELSEKTGPSRLAGKGARSFSSGASGMGGGMMPLRRSVSATPKPDAPMRSRNAVPQPPANASSSVAPPLPAVAKGEKTGWSMTGAKRKTKTAVEMAKHLEAGSVLVVKVALNRLPDSAKDSRSGGAIAKPAERVVQLVQSETGLAVVSPFALTTPVDGSTPEHLADKPAKPVQALDSLGIPGHTVVYAEGAKGHVRALLEQLSRRKDLVVSLIGSPDSRMMYRQKAAASTQAGSPPPVADAMNRSKTPAGTQQSAKKKEDEDRKVAGQAPKIVPGMRTIRGGLRGMESFGQLDDTRKRSQRVKPIVEPESPGSDMRNGLAAGGGRLESQVRMTESESAAEPNTAYIVLRVTKPNEVPTSRGQKK